jgi:hypothetical protein
MSPKTSPPIVGYLRATEQAARALRLNVQRDPATVRDPVNRGHLSDAFRTLCRAAALANGGDHE